MIEAIQVFVRGFETERSGDVIVEVLENYGFIVTEFFDGQSDNRGGLIETDICEVGHLDGDLEALREAVFAVAPPGTFVQHRTFSLDSEGEVHAPFSECSRTERIWE